jgi:tape measure domain-containing protein
MAETLGQAVLEVGVDDSRLRAGLAGVEGQVRRTSSVIGELGGLIAGIGAITAFGGLINAASELESITRRLANTLGDQGAQQALGFTRELSDRLGLSFTVLSDSFAAFTAAASAANIPLQEQQGLFEAVSTSAQRLGLSNDAINGSLLALQQVAAKGTVQMEELRGQLGERLPTAFAATARGLGISNKELIKLVESGQLTADQFFPALTKGLTELNGSGPAGVPTAAQNFASLQNVLRTLQADFGKEFLPGVVAGTQKIAEFLQGFTANQRAADLSGAFGFGPREAQQLVGQLDFVEKKFGLTREQSKNIVSDALKIISDSRDEFDPLLNSFGQLTLTGDEYVKVLGLIEERSKSFTAPARALRDLEQQQIANARAEQQASDRRLDTLDKINARLKTARKELGSLDPNSADAQAKREEIANLETQGKSVEERSRAIQKAVEDAARKSKEVADNFQKAADAVKTTAQSFAETVASSRFASESAQRQARDTLERRAAETLNSGAVNRDAVAREFGLPIAQAGSLSIEGGGQSFQRSFTNQVAPLDLRGLGLDKLAELVQQTAPLADGAKSIQESNSELVKATQELTAAQRAALERESNLAITVPVGATRNVYLP